jgi:hypothetical protein
MRNSLANRGKNETARIAGVVFAQDAFPVSAFGRGNEKREETKLETKRRFSFPPLKTGNTLETKLLKDWKRKRCFVSLSFCHGSAIS